MHNEVTVERLDRYTARDAAAIGTLLPSLTPDFSGNPINKALLDEIIMSPHHDQLVARIAGDIVGIATLSITIGVGAGRKAYLEDFVVSPEHQGKGIGSALWRDIAKWCRKHNAPLHFTSSAKRKAAHQFYLKHGATIHETVVFRYDPR